MARVAVIMKVLPNAVEVTPDQLLEKIKETLPEDYKIMGSGEEPIAFGLKALKIIISIPEETEGGTEKLEEIIKGIDIVEEVEVEAVHRL
ncbi:MAG: elongation factor 1-beta [Desulfurococcales archaeon]|nr:elongation factor 1-beta [Desulfurococcales archaeon]MCE4622828.1 elongation factor 1-beta [Desulfurococcales archaeon]MCE4627046.1 elongation factor 1-beta [Desulfurococcales archaeon]MCE4629159.1 elongation factor 1-beta [Desulfurococcales archaeon]NOZ31376.1 elongation factor 1-beta [Thermoproteota archaeon]